MGLSRIENLELTKAKIPGFEGESSSIYRPRPGRNSTVALMPRERDPRNLAIQGGIEWFLAIRRAQVTTRLTAGYGDVPRPG